MKQLIIIGLLSLINFQNIFTQESSLNKNRLNLKIMPLSVIDYAPRYRIGLEYISKGRLGYGIDLGIGNDFLNKWRSEDLWGPDYSFYEARPEIKYVFGWGEYYYSYCALEFFYMDMRVLLESGHYEKEDSNVETTYDLAKFSKQKYGIHLKYGINIIVFKNLNFDLYGGIGVAKRIITYTDVVNPVDQTGPIFIEFPSNYLFEGESVFLHLSLGFKIGYTFWSK
jgi:hypothetical protein